MYETSGRYCSAFHSLGISTVFPCHFARETVPFGQVSSGRFVTRSGRLTRKNSRNGWRWRESNGILGYERLRNIKSLTSKDGDSSPSDCSCFYAISMMFYPSGVLKFESWNPREIIFHPYTKQICSCIKIDQWGPWVSTERLPRILPRAAWSMGRYGVLSKIRAGVNPFLW